MISYSQNGEDIVLARGLGDVPRGTYIDVGAGSPSIDSVTRHFYEHGWRGINIEPVQAQYRQLCAERPDDVNLAVAIGSSPGRAVLYDFGSEWGWSTLSEEIAMRHRDDGLAFTQRDVEITTLAEVCHTHVKGEIDFLKIDVEGREFSVLEGADFDRWRPRVVVIEATAPGTGEPTHQEWEHILVGASYAYAYFDGVNRFYVAAECAEMIPRLAVQPNWFDHAERDGERQLRLYVATLEDHVRGQQTALRQHEAQIEQLARFVDALQGDILAKDAHIEEVRAYVAHLLDEISSRDGRLAILERDGEREVDIEPGAR